MGLGSFFQKKEKPSFDEQVLNAGVKLKALQRKYNIIIEREIRVLRAAQGKKNKNIRSQKTLKNAYYSLIVVNTALDHLYDLSTQHELAQAMNETGSVLLMMNAMENKNTRVHALFNEVMIKIMDHNITTKGGRTTGDMLHDTTDGASGHLKADLVDDSIIDDLVSGRKKLKECLEEEDGLLFDTDDIKAAAAEVCNEEELQPVDDAELAALLEASQDL